jgi:hypothetical protein
MTDQQKVRISLAIAAVGVAISLYGHASHSAGFKALGNFTVFFGMLMAEVSKLLIKFCGGYRPPHPSN